MPQIVNRTPQTSQPTADAKPVAQVSVSNHARGAVPEDKLRKIVVGAGVLTLVLILFLFHTYVHPIIPQAANVHKVAPLPGMPDDYPYNTLEWQQAYKKGRTSFISGVPRPPAGGYGPRASSPGAPSGQ